MENKFKLSIFYEDQLKRIPLVTVPNQHLSTFETEEVHKHLKRTVQSVFGLPPGTKFKFYDKMSGKELTAQRFSSDNFPKYWTLVVSGNLKGSISPEYSPPTPKVVPAVTKLTEMNDIEFRMNGNESPQLEGEYPLYGISLDESSREICVIRDAKGFGFILRYFDIHEDHTMDGDPQNSHVSEDSVDTMITVFVHKLRSDSPAERAGLKEGDKIFSINSQRITNCNFSDLKVILDSIDDELSVVISPKTDDVLQSYGYAAIAYGEPGEYDTKYGHAQVNEVDLGCFEILPLKSSSRNRSRHESDSSFQSNDSHHNAKIAPVYDRVGGRESALSSGHHGNNVNSSREENLNQGTSGSSHEELYIHGRLAELPVSPRPFKQEVRRGSPWAFGGDVHTMMLEDRTVQDIDSKHHRQLSGFSTDSFEADLHHSRQVSTDSDFGSGLRRLSRDDGKLFNEADLLKLVEGNQATFASETTSSRIFSDSNMSSFVASELRSSVSPINSQGHSSQSQGETSLEPARRKSSIRKASLEDLTRFEDGDTQTLSASQQSNHSSEVTAKQVSLSQDSAGSVEDVKRKGKSYQQQRTRHRPSMVAAMDNPYNIFPVEKKRQGRKSNTSMASFAEITEEESTTPKTERSDASNGKPLASSSWPRSKINMVPRSQSYERLDEVVREDEEETHRQSQPEGQIFGTGSIKKPRPQSAGGKLSLRYATYHGKLERKVEKDESTKKSRGWKTCYAVLKGEKLLFYKDQSEAETGSLVNCTVVELDGGKIGIARDYTKKQNVLRLSTSSGQEILLHVSSDQLKTWIDVIHNQTGNQDGPYGLDSSHDGSSLPTGLSLDQYLDPSLGSLKPQHTRRASTSKDEGGGSWRKFFKQKNSKTQGSTQTFKVPLENCPMSERMPYLPRVVELCTNEIETRGLETEGLYRVPGNEAVINQLIAEINKGNFDPGSVTDEWIDIHIATTLLKRFLKQLPDSLIPQCKYQDFIIAGRAPNQEGMVTRLKELIGQLPPANFHTLQRISDNLATIMEHSEINKMNANNLAIAFGPTLFRSPEGEDMVKNMKANVNVVETLINHGKELFDQIPPETKNGIYRQYTIEEPVTGSKSLNFSAALPSPSQQSQPQPVQSVNGKAKTKIPARSKSSLTAGSKPALEKVNKNERTMTWVAESDFQGSQEENDEAQRKVVGSMWAKGHNKRRVSVQFRHLNSTSEEVTSPPPEKEEERLPPTLEGSQDSPGLQRSFSETSKSKQRILAAEERRNSLSRKESYVHAVGEGRPTMRPRFHSADIPEDPDLKEFFSSMAGPADRMVHDFLMHSQKPQRKDSNNSNNAPLTTLDESYL